MDPEAKIIFGAVYDPRLKKGEIKMTVIATGFGDHQEAPKNTLHHSAVKQAQSIPVTVEKSPGEVSSFPLPASVRGVSHTGESHAGHDKKIEQKHKPFTPEVTKVVEDGWDIPAFMRRKK